MITFITSIFALICGTLSLYLLLRSDLRKLLRHSRILILFTLFEVLIPLAAVCFILASISPSASWAQIYTKLALTLLRLEIIVLFIFSETVRRARYYFTKFFIVATIFGINIVTYGFISFEFRRVYGFWERVGVLEYGIINVIDLALPLLVVALVLISIILTAKSALSGIKSPSKRRLVVHYYYWLWIILFVDVTLFIVLRFLVIGVLANSVVLLLGITGMALLMIILVVRYPYFLYAGCTTLLGLMIIGSESGVLIHEEGVISGDLFIPSAFWATVNLMERRLHRKPILISFCDSYAVINYVGPIIGIYIFDRYFDELQVFSRHLSEMLAESLRRHGLIGGLFIEDEEVKQEIAKTIREVLDPFIP